MKPARTPLVEGRPFMVRVCPTCGQEFPTQKRAQYCSKACQERAWRYAMVLAGTHDSLGMRIA